MGAADTVINSPATSSKIEGTACAGAPPSCNGVGGGETGQGYKAAADPIDPQNTRYFATNANGQIYEDTSSLFPNMPEAGEPLTGHLLR